MALNNNQVANVLNEAFKISTGEEGVVALDLSNVVDVGNNADILKEKESFTEADLKNEVNYLCGVITVVLAVVAVCGSSS